MNEEAEALVRAKYASLAPVMGEAMTRLWAAAEARSLGHGGIACVMRATGLARDTIAVGLRDLDDPEHQARLAAGHVRRPGAGRKRQTELQPELADDRQAAKRFLREEEHREARGGVAWAGLRGERRHRGGAAQGAGL